MDPEAMMVQLLEREEQGERLKFLMFWGHSPKRADAPGPWVLSQWFPSEFEVDGDEYPTAEHYMMAEKARLFGDDAAREAILSTDDPGHAKALGREVRGFDEARWGAERFGIVVRGNLAKFDQDGGLGDYLRNTGDRIVVEASPRDRIWGIGMGVRNELVETPSAWRGLNLLGFALMVVRDRLRSAEQGDRSTER